jgi:hypothetical protein
MVNPELVDIRLAVGEPKGEAAIRLVCPMHRERLGVEDERASLAVYRHNLHCFGCGFHLRRRYAALAFLLGMWDGRGSEESEKVREVVRKLRRDLPKFLSSQPARVAQQWKPPPPDPRMVEGFHRFLLRSAVDRLRVLQRERGLLLPTIVQHRLGYTGTHYTIPVYSLLGGLETVRYRADDEVVDSGDDAYQKYVGYYGYNAPYLYPLPCLVGVRSLRELWVVEGEYDALASNQALMQSYPSTATLTITNGARSLAHLFDMVRQCLPDLSVRLWVIATDQDAAGERAACELMEKLDLAGEVGVRARWKGAKDLTDYYRAGGRVREIVFE